MRLDKDRVFSSKVAINATVDARIKLKQEKEALAESDLRYSDVWRSVVDACQNGCFQVRLSWVFNVNHGDKQAIPQNSHLLDALKTLGYKVSIGDFDYNRDIDNCIHDIIISWWPAKEG